MAKQSVDNLYRAIVRFMMVHVSACEDIPREIKDLSPKTARKPGTLGVKNAKEMGLVDGEYGNNIFYRKTT